MRRPGQYEPQKTTRVADYDFDDDDDDYPDPSDYVYYHEELAKKEREQQKKQEMKRPVLKMPMMVPTISITWYPMYGMLMLSFTLTVFL